MIENELTHEHIELSIKVKYSDCFFYSQSEIPDDLSLQCRVLKHSQNTNFRRTIPFRKEGVTKHNHEKQKTTKKTNKQTNVDSECKKPRLQAN